jgi:hypothetical protein
LQLALHLLQTLYALPYATNRPLAQVIIGLRD